MNLTPANATIGFIGTGVMGKSMAGHLLKAGYTVHVYNRTRDKARELLDHGAIWEENAAALAKKCNVIITMVGYPRDVEETYLGSGGLIQHAKPGSYLVDMTTSSPRLAAQIYQAAKDKGLHALDAPVSGGDIGAREARLAIMVGGDQAAFDAAAPIWRLWGGNIVQPDSHCRGYAGYMRSNGLCQKIRP